MKLLFVYNADTGLFNAVADATHKLLFPNTYSCNLCKITYGVVSMKKDWKIFLQSLPYELEFLHKDEFYIKYPDQRNLILPAILRKENDRIDAFLSAQEINTCKTLEDLKSLITKKI